MDFRRSQRWLVGCAIAALVSAAVTFPAMAAPEAKTAPAKTAAKPAQKTTPAKTAAKPAAKPEMAKATAKPAAKLETAKTAKPSATPEKTKAKVAAKPEKAKTAKAPTKPSPTKAAKAVSKLATAKSTAPAPRARPQFNLTSAPNPSIRDALSPVQILPTSLSPMTPAVAVTPPAAPTYAPPPARASLMPAAPFAAAQSTSTPAADVALAKQAVDLARRGKTTDATSIAKSIGDPLARKLVEWTILRSEENDAGFDRLAAFSAENPSWPNATMMRRRAESALWDERRGASTVLAFFQSQKPFTAKGKFALARALLAQGDQPGAAQLARTAWRDDTCSAAVEKAVMETFSEILTRADHKARMDRRFYDDDPDAAMRMAQLLGGNDLLIGKARKAVVDKSSNARALLEAVPAGARNDAGYIFHKAQWLRREDKPIEAARLLQSAPRSASQLHNLEDWWTERRLVARKLLDMGEHQAAYVVARDAIPPTKDNPRAEHEFTAGWIALRFTDNPTAAYQHFSRIGHGTTNPITLARGEYWQGRALEAAGRNCGGARALSGRRAVSHRLLRPDRARPAWARRTDAAPPARAFQSRGADEPRSRARRATALRRRRARPRHSVRKRPCGERGRHRRACGDRRDRPQARRRARDAADRQGRAQPRLRVRRLRLPDQRHSGLPHGRARRSTRASCTRSPGRKARSIRARCRAPMRSA